MARARAPQKAVQSHKTTKRPRDRQDEHPATPRPSRNATTAMSLNFVSSAVLTSTDGVSHNEEKAVETTEANSVRRQQEAGGHRPLFEQLRSNADQAQDERDAATKAMRGSRTLDEDDCAHLDSIERRRMERDAAVRRGVEDEVAAFRAARAERMAEGSTELPGEEGGGDDDAGDVMKVAASKPSAAAHTDDASGPSLAKLAPKFVIKKKRKRQSPGSALSGATTTGSTSTAGEDATSKRQKDENEAAQKKEQGSDVVEDNSQDGDNDSGSDDDAGGGLGALLGGYGSDSDSE